MPKTETKEKLHFIFTEKGFVLEHSNEIVDEKIKKWKKKFEADKYQTIYDMSFIECPKYMDAAGVYLYRIAESFQKQLTRRTDLELQRESFEFEPDKDELDRLLGSAPFSPGTENIKADWLIGQWECLQQVYCREIAAYKGTVSFYFAEKSENLRLPERIFFHLVEHKEEPDFPFAFVATYSTRLKNGKVKHMPLTYALTEYKQDREKLLELLSCLNKAAEVSELIHVFVKSGEMFHPLRLSIDEAYRFLLDVPQIESAGIVCRIPNWWRKQACSVQLSVKLGEDKPSLFGAESILSMQPELTVDGLELTSAEVELLLKQTEGLAFLKGKWISVNHERLQELLESMDQYRDSVTFIDALRMGLAPESETADPDVGPLITNGAWLQNLLVSMRSPEKIKAPAVPKSFQAKLRPYQKNGYTWLDYMSSLGFGACLADDMGLGKTVQVLAFLENLRKNMPEARVLLIVPASLIGNWQKEKEKFAPSMTYAVLHGNAAARAAILQNDQSFLTITTYGMIVRTPELEERQWDCLILDEAQAIKNPLTKQTRQIKRLNSKMRIAMTGTPIENDLTNLWSLFDFLNKGLLGNATEFQDYCKGLDEHPEGYARLKAMISPFMLRRLKTDKTIISDLPDKLEQVDYVELSKKQVVLYRKYVADMAKKINEAKGMERRGIVLASLTKLKQICNHPDQYLGQNAFEEKDSGKFSMLREICEIIYEKRERVLVFTQFKEVIPFLDDFLQQIFHQKGLVLHGGTAVKTRGRLVELFQGEEYVPYMILSVKAGGTGLNLTRASHVIHFDRWWNPAVENQATDRAFRIGQQKNVVVHKLVCKGTIEEKINTLIESKKELAQNVIGSGGENWITEMSNDELMNILRLD